MNEPAPGADRESRAAAEAEHAAEPNAAEIPSAPQPEAPDRAAAAAPSGAGRRGLIWLAAMLVLVIAAVATSPFWAPVLRPLLPWGQRAAIAERYAALAARLDQIEKRPTPSAAALADIRSGQEALAQRVARLETKNPPDDRLETAVAAAQGAVQHFGHRLDMADAQSANAANGLQKVQQQLADLGRRVGALEARTEAQIGVGRTDAALLLALMQLREAVEAGHPFAAQYAAFAALAQGRSDLAAAARPLEKSAAAGVTGRDALRQGLSGLAQRLGAAPPQAVERDWWAQALGRLRGLVTVHRIGLPPSRREAALDKAQAALADNDLAAAVAALGALGGADAEAAQPWLGAARARLAAEATLARLQELLTVRLGAAPAPSPAAVPGAAPAKPGAPS